MAQETIVNLIWYNYLNWEGLFWSRKNKRIEILCSFTHRVKEHLWLQIPPSANYWLIGPNLSSLIWRLKFWIGFKQQEWLYMFYWGKVPSNSFLGLIQAFSRNVMSFQMQCIQTAITGNPVSQKKILIVDGLIQLYIQWIIHLWA